MANALFNKISGDSREGVSVDLGNLEALNDRYIDFGLRPPDHVDEEVPEVEDLEEEPARLWKVEGKKPPSLKVRWFLHEEAPRERPSWFARNVTFSTILSWASHAAAVFVVALWPSTRFEISVSQEFEPVEIVFAPNLVIGAPGQEGQQAAIAEEFAEVTEPKVPEQEITPDTTVADLIEQELQEELEIEEIEPLPPEIEDVATSEVADSEEVDAMEAIASLPETELPDVEPIPEPEPEPLPEPEPEQPVGTGPEAPDPVDVAEPSFEPAEQAPLAEEELAELDAPELFDEEISVPEPLVPEPLVPDLLDPEPLFEEPPEADVEIAIDGNDIPVNPLVDLEQTPPAELTELPQEEPVISEEDQVAALIERFAPEVDVAEDPTFPEPEEVPQFAPAGELEELEAFEPEEPFEPQVAEIPEPETQPEPLPEPVIEPEPSETFDLAENFELTPTPLEPLESLEEREEAPSLFEEEVAAVPEPDPLEPVEPDRETAQEALAEVLARAEQLAAEAGLTEEPQAEDAETELQTASIPDEPVVEEPELDIPLPPVRPFIVEDPEPEPQPEAEPQPTQVAGDGEAGQGQGTGSEGTGTGAALSGDGSGNGSQVAASGTLLPRPGAQNLTRPPQQPEAPPRTESTFTKASFSDPSLGNKNPEYPERLRRRGVQGRVILRVVVSPDGTPLVVEVTRSSGSFELDNATKQTVSGWRAIPASRDGKPVLDAVEVEFTFRLE